MNLPVEAYLLSILIFFIVLLLRLISTSKRKMYKTWESLHEVRQGKRRKNVPTNQHRRKADRGALWIH